MDIQDRQMYRCRGQNDKIDRCRGQIKGSADSVNPHKPEYIDRIDGWIDRQNERDRFRGQNDKTDK